MIKLFCAHSSAEFVFQVFFVIVGIENFDIADRSGQFATEYGVEKMHQQVTVVLSIQQHSLFLDRYDVSCGILAIAGKKANQQA